MARRQKKVEEKSGSGESGSGRWMLTYLDMVTLLFGVFVLLYALKEDNPQKVKLVADSIRQAFLGQGIGSTGLLQGGLTSLRVRDKQGRAYLDAYKRATELFKPEVKSKQVRIEEQERGVIISFVGENYFAHGSAHLTETTKMALSKVSQLIRGLDAFIRIEGYSDEIDAMGELDFEKSKYPTDWELAAARAVNSLRYLNEIEDIEPGKMSATSYGRYRKISKSDTPEGRSLNRRVDIVIIKRANFTRGYQEDQLPENKVPGMEMDFGP